MIHCNGQRILDKIPFVETSGSVPKPARPVQIPNISLIPDNMEVISWTNDTGLDCLHHLRYSGCRPLWARLEVIVLIYARDHPIGSLYGRVSSSPSLHWTNSGLGWYSLWNEMKSLLIGEKSSEWSLRNNKEIMPRRWGSHDVLCCLSTRNAIIYHSVYMRPENE
jgi:hypothetical protein